jgi:putative ABC transport system substrate-binding protein
MLAPASASASARVLLVETRDNPFYNQAMDGFRQGLKSRGFDESRVDLVTIVLTGDPRSDAKKISDQMQRKNQLIVTIGTDATSAIMDAHVDAPVIFSMVLDPVALGAVKSLSSPEGNFTGTTLEVNPGKQIDALLQAAPSAKRIGVLYTDGDETSGNLLSQARLDAQALGAQIVAVPVTSNMKTQDALNKLDGQVDAIWIIPDQASTGSDAFAQTLAYAQDHKLPILGSSYATVKAGALLALSADLTDAGDLTADMAAQILDGNTSVAQMAVRGPRKTILTINLDAARSLRIKMPDSVIHLADDVVDSEIKGN